MAIYPTKTNKINNKNRRLKLGVSLTIVFSLLLVFVAFNLIDIFTIIVLGSIGLFFYPMCIIFITIGILLICGKKVKTTKTIVTLTILWVVFFVMIMQMATSTNIDSGFAEYISTTFKSCTTAGGVIFGTLLYPVYSLTYNVATYTLLIVALVIVSAFLLDRLYIELQKEKSEQVTAVSNQNIVQDETLESDTIDSDVEPELDDSEDVESDNDDEIFISDEEEQRQMAKSILGLSKQEPTNEEDETIEDDATEEESYIENINISQPQEEPIVNKTDTRIHDEQETITTTKQMVRPEKQNDQAEMVKKAKLDEERRQAALDYLNISNGKFETNLKKNGIDNVTAPTKNMWEDNTADMQEQTKSNNDRLDNMSARETLFGSSNTSQSGVQQFTQVNYQSTNPDREETLNNLNKPENNDLYDEKLTKANVNEYRQNYSQSSRSFNNSITDIPKKAQEIYSGEEKEERVEAQGFKPVQVSMIEPDRPKSTQKVYKKPPVYNRPPIDLLKSYPYDIDVDEAQIRAKGKLIEDTLAAFKLETKVINATKGPTFTRYELQMTPGISVNSVGTKMNDLAMVLESQCRIQIPIPGKNAFGIEVPNKKRVTVGLRDILESDNFKNSKSPLTFALGKDIAGDCKVASIDKLTHILVAGSTGSGKSVCLNTLLASILYKAAPDEVKLLLVDPKTVEFSLFNNLPHMLIPNTITECDKAVMALSWLVEEMDNRYKRLNALCVKNIREYNESTEVLTGQVEKMYYIVMVFDEVGDFMVRAKKEIEEKVNLLAAKARACGIHLILATQRPTVDVITGTIKANLPSRIAFFVRSYQDSKTILDTSGAEYLLGMGDMLFCGQGSTDPERIQGCFVDTNELKAVINYVKENNEAIFDEEIEHKMFTKDEGFDSTGGSAEAAFDTLMKDCLRYFLRSKKVSTSSLQGYFGIGYPRANKIVQQMERAGFVSPGDSNGRRALYMTEQEFEERFGEDLNE